MGNVQKYTSRRLRAIFSRVLTKGGFAFAAATVLLLAGAHAADVPQSFTVDGRLYSDTAGTIPLNDGNITFKVQILDDAKLCVVYEEQQSISTAFSTGYFSVQVGSIVGAPVRTAGDSANTMATVFQNINSVSGKLLSNGAACTVTAVGGNRRYVRITISPSTMGGTPRILNPDLTIDSVPNAVVAERAETLQGYRSTDMLKVNTTGSNVLSQNNLESLFMTSTRFNELTALIDGTSNSFVRASTNGAQLPVITGAPAAPAQGAIWYDTSDNKLKYRTGIATTETLGTSSGTVTSVALSAPAEFSVANSPLTSNGSLDLTWATQTTNKVLAAPNGSTGVPSFRALLAADIPALPYVSNATGTANSIPKFTGVGAIGNSAISDDGTTITATRSVASITNPLTGVAAINLATSNTHTLDALGTPTGAQVITTTNPSDGGIYNIVIEDTTVRTYTFSACTGTSYYKPANAPTTTGTRSVYGLMTVKKGALYDCYITWSSGFAP